jgi:hypothetical protein
MPSDWVELGKEVLRLAVRARYSFSIWVVAFIILVLPLPAFLHLEAFRRDHGQYIGLIGLIMFVVWIVEVTLMGSEMLTAYRAARKEEWEILKHRDSLNSQEAGLLNAAVSQKSQTLNCRPDIEEVHSLVAKGLFLVVPDSGGMDGRFCRPYTIPRFVWEEINKPDLAAKLATLAK